MNGIEQKPIAQRGSSISAQNDEFRQDLIGKRFFMTAGILEASGNDLPQLIALIEGFDAFDESNDPYGEHDFGSLAWRGEPIYWKIDYYDLDLKYASPDPANPDVTSRVLTIMMAWEY